MNQKMLKLPAQALQCVPTQPLQTPTWILSSVQSDNVKPLVCKVTGRKWSRGLLYCGLRRKGSAQIGLSHFAECVFVWGPNQTHECPE